MRVQTALDGVNSSAIRDDAGPSLSQASSILPIDEELDELMANYSTQRSTQPTDPASNRADGSFEPLPPPTQCSTESKNEDSSSADSLGSVVGVKRKASATLSRQEPPPRRATSGPFKLRLPLVEEPPQFKERTAGTETDSGSRINKITFPCCMMGILGTASYAALFEFVRTIRKHEPALNYSDVMVGELTKFRDQPTHVAAVALVRETLSKLTREKRPELAGQGDDTEFFIRLFDKEVKARDAWVALDAEDQLLKKDPKYGAMGYKDDGSPSENYGGQVHFRGILGHCKTSGKFTVDLEEATIGPSYLFSRRFGSKSFFRIKLGKSAKVVPGLCFDYLRNPFVICGRVFRAFYAKDDTVFLFKTNEIWLSEDVIIPGPKGGDGMSFEEFINWFNPMDLNRAQPVAKWASRFSLGLSNSAPGFLLKLEDIRFGEDIINPETEANMTDGAGTLNRFLIRRIAHRYEWKERPTAFQVRVHGSKGLLIEHSADYSDEPTVCLTPSQRKVIYPNPKPGEELDRAFLAIDVLRASHLKTACRLSSEIIVNLAENGVPKRAFVDLLENDLKQILAPFLDWNSHDALPRMWVALERRGGVIASRRARAQPGMARLKGYSEREVDDNEPSDNGRETENGHPDLRSSAGWPDVVSGLPVLKEEKAMGLLDVGFSPAKLPYLRDQLKRILQTYVKREIRAFRAEVPMSATGFIVPDTSGVLEEGEIFLMSSERNLEMPDGIGTNVLVGDVLLARHPCKLPTDVQKWKAVNKPELHYLVDVIVLSTKGKKRAADWLAGGDYDGDKALVIWQPQLVRPFKNAKPEYAEEPEVMSKNFEKQIETVPALLERMKAMNTEDRIHTLQHSLLAAVRMRSLVGQYSNAHDVAVYTKGYASKEARRLAFMFCLTLDGAKSGMTVKKEVAEKDNRQWGQRSPAWKEWKETKEIDEPKINTSNLPHPKRASGHGKFIMDDLQNDAQSSGDIFLKEIDDHFDLGFISEEDPVLSAPYLELGQEGWEWCRKGKKLIEMHVEECYGDYIRRREDDIRAPKTTTHSPRKSPRKGNREVGSGGSGSGERTLEERQDILREASRKFASKPDWKECCMPKSLVDRVKASYAYYYDCHYSKKDSPRTGVNWSRFPFEVAYRELGRIKAESLNNPKSICASFQEHCVFKPPKV